MITNIGLLIEEVLTGEPNEKEPTFNKEPSPDNDEVKNIFIGGLCVFEKIMVYHRSLLGNICKYTWIPDHYSSPKKLQKYSSDSSDCWRVKNNLSQT